MDAGNDRSKQRSASQKVTAVTIKTGIPPVAGMLSEAILPGSGPLGTFIGAALVASV